MYRPTRGRPLPASFLRIPSTDQPELRGQHLGFRVITNRLLGPWTISLTISRMQTPLQEVQTSLGPLELLA